MENGKRFSSDCLNWNNNNNDDEKGGRVWPGFCKLCKITVLKFFVLFNFSFRLFSAPSPTILSNYKKKKGTAGLWEAGNTIQPAGCGLLIHSWREYFFFYLFFPPSFTFPKKSWTRIHVSACVSNFSHPLSKIDEKKKARKSRKEVKVFTENRKRWREEKNISIGGVRFDERI